MGFIRDIRQIGANFCRGNSMNICGEVTAPRTIVAAVDATGYRVIGYRRLAVAAPCVDGEHLYARARARAPRYDFCVMHCILPARKLIQRGVSRTPRPLHLYDYPANDKAPRTTAD